MRLLALLAIAALFASMAPPLATQAEEGGEAIPVGDFRLLDPVKDMLSASSWVMATGQDPRLMDIPTGGRASPSMRARRSLRSPSAYSKPHRVKSAQSSSSRR